MNSKSAFEKILDQYLNPQGQPKVEQEGSHPKVTTFQFDLNMQFPFSFGPLGDGVKPEFRKQYKTSGVPKVEVIPTPEKKIEKTIKSKVKRKLTFDQEKALKIFSCFGESHIDEYSTDEEIKGAFRRLAKKYHPDFSKTKGDEFKLISSAYEKILI